MTLFPGDEIVSSDGRKFTLGALMAYQGKEGCDSPRCTRRNSKQRDDGSWDWGECFGWHCPTCDESTSSMGHKCPMRGEA